MKLRLVLSIICLTFTLSGSASESVGGQSGKTKAASNEPMPNPMNLTPNWWNYFENENENFNKQSESFLEELNKLIGTIENADQRKLAEGRANEIQSYLDSLELLDYQKHTPPATSWMPKETYTLDEYLAASKNKQQLGRQIKSINIEIERFRYNTQEIQQTLSNKYALYLNSKKEGVEKLLNGLEIIGLKTKLVYLHKMTTNLQQQQRDTQQLLERYQKELELIPSRIEIAVSNKELELSKEHFMEEYVNAHNIFLDMEKNTILSKDSEHEKNGASQRINQKLTNSLLKATIARTEFEFVNAVLVLKKNEKKQTLTAYKNDIRPIRVFLNDTKQKLLTWQQIVSSEFERLSISQKNEEENDEYKNQLTLMLENRMLLNELSDKLSKIQSILTLIDQTSFKKESIWNKVRYYYHSLSLNAAEWFVGWTSFSLFEIRGIPVTIFGIIKAVFIIIIALWLSKIVQKFIIQLSQKKGRASESTYYSFARVAHYIIVLLGILVSLGSLGLNFNSIAIVLGALGIGIGFGLQGVVNNFICGLTILFERNIKVGDLVELQSGHFGKVTEVNIQNTTVHTWDGLDVLVPNANIVGNQVVNWTKQDPYLRLHIPFVVAYGSDQDEITTIVCEAAKQVPATLTRAQGMKDPEVWMIGFRENSLNFELVVWVNIFQTGSKSSLRACYLSEIEKTFKAHQINVPFPQRDLHIKSLPPGSERIPFETKPSDEK